MERPITAIEQDIANRLPDDPPKQRLILAAPKANGLFHKCWAQAQESPAYDKSVWVELQRELVRLGIRV